MGTVQHPLLLPKPRLLSRCHQSSRVRLSLKGSIRLYSYHSLRWLVWEGMLSSGIEGHAEGPRRWSRLG